MDSGRFIDLKEVEIGERKFAISKIPALKAQLIYNDIVKSVADDVLQGGKVCSDPPSSDPQTRGLLEFNDLVRSDDRVEVVMLPLPDGLSLIRKK